MLPPTTIVFDLDGTLIDSRGDIVAAVNHALKAEGRVPLPGPVIVRFIGDGARALCARAARVPESAELATVLLAHFTAYYIEHPIDFTRWAPGAQETLDVLSEVPDVALALCTNKPRAITDAVLAALDLTTRFRAVVAGGDLPEKKPAAAPLLKVAQLLGTEADGMVMVGDGPQDIECARRARVRSIAIDSGFNARDRLVAAQPDVILRNLSELPSVIERWRAATVRLPPPDKRP